MIIRAGDIVIHRDPCMKGTHLVTEALQKTMGCGCRMTLQIKLDGKDQWYDAKMYRLFIKMIFSEG